MRSKLRSIRLELGMTRREVAAKIGVTVRQYGNIETGKRNPSKKVIDQLEDLFGIPQRVLLVPDCTSNSNEKESA